MGSYLSVNVHVTRITTDTGESLWLDDYKLMWLYMQARV